MMKIFVVATLIAASTALTPEHITGTTPPPVYCPSHLCDDKADGNYEYYYQGTYESNYFLQCSNGQAQCQACFPLSLEYSPYCNQCLYSKTDECVTTKKWEPVTTFECPDLCQLFGPEFSGNIEDPRNSHQYIACRKGITVGCIACPAGLEFNQKWNACLYHGIYKTEPLNGH